MKDDNLKSDLDVFHAINSVKKGEMYKESPMDKQILTIVWAFYVFVTCVVTQVQTYRCIQNWNKNHIKYKCN